MDKKVLNRKFGLVTGAVCILIAIYQQLVHHRFLLALLVIGILLILIALVVPLILNSIRLLWERIGEFMGIINTLIILFLVFFLIVTPIGYIMRLMKKGTLDINPKVGANTYWKQAKTIEQNSMNQQF
jgi:hypothetical protein